MVGGLAWAGGEEVGRGVFPPLRRYSALANQFAEGRLLLAEQSSQQVYHAFDDIVVSGCFDDWKFFIKGVDYLGGEHLWLECLLLLRKLFFFCSYIGQ